jgi:hypothetical protein
MDGQGKQSLSSKRWEALRFDLLGGKELKIKDGVDGGGKYKIVNPSSLYLGKSYGDWITDWFNWFLSAEADSRNSGPVVFLRSRGLPNSTTGANISDVLRQVVDGTDPTSGSQSAGVDDEYRGVYVNDPNIRIGNDRLQIFDDQAVFVPMIVAYALSSPTHLYKDWGRMEDFTGLTIDYGDNPPLLEQLTINNDPIVLGEMIINQFRIATPIFTAVVPDAPYGSSLKDFLEDSPIAPGSYPALVEGYFVMLKFEPGSYWVHSWASAPREKFRPYFSELLYQIEVNLRPERDVHKGLMTERPLNGDMTKAIRPSRNERIFNRTMYEKTKTGELTPEEISRFKKYLRVKSGTLLASLRPYGGPGPNGNSIRAKRAT